MSALVFVNARIIDPDKFAQYGAAAGPTVAAHGGSFVLRGKFNANLDGDSELSLGAVIRFPDAQAAKDWYASDAYQQIIPLREAASEMTLTIFDEAA